MRYETGESAEPELENSTGCIPVQAPEMLAGPTRDDDQDQEGGDQMARLMIDVVREELNVLLDYFKPITSEELNELVVILRSALQEAEDQRRELWREQD